MTNPVRLVLLDRIGARVVVQALRIVERELVADVSVLGEAKCDSGFDPARQQWRAESMLGCVERYRSTGHFIVAITSRNLYVPSLNFVFGLALRESGSAIVSWQRLGDSESTVFIMRLAKEIIYEVGHLERLEHCPNRECVMWFSNTLSETDRKGPGFCERCRLIRSRLKKGPT